IVPYVQPTVSFVAGSGRTSALEFGFGVGADFRLSRVLDARVSGGLGDHPLTGVSIAAVWVHRTEAGYGGWWRLVEDGGGVSASFTNLHRPPPTSTDLHQPPPKGYLC